MTACVCIGARMGGSGSADHLEKRIMELEGKKREVESAVAAAIVDGDHQLGKRLASNLDRISRLRGDLYTQWEEAAK